MVVAGAVFVVEKWRVLSLSRKKTELAWVGPADAAELHDTLRWAAVEKGAPY
jgi:hypothetical protein